jgi:secreted PhoX family phosphatase
MRTRRDFNFGLASLAFGGLALANCSALQKIPDAFARAPGFRRAQNRRVAGFGELIPDPAEVIDLPAGLMYSAHSCFGESLEGGGAVPDAADGMGSFDLGDGLVALVRNHELDAGEFDKGAFRGGGHGDLPAYDRSSAGRPLPGGTTTIVYDYENHEFVRHYLSLAGTIRNCAGGVTPWGTWLTCEEDVTRRGGALGKDHGWVFEVPARHAGPVDATPLRDMGRFNHEAAAVDRRTGIVYLTEDQRDGLFYRFLPKVPGKLAEGGRLQALALAGVYTGGDARNWSGSTIPVGIEMPVRWIDLSEVHSPAGDDLRKRGHEAGATRFANAEGIHFGQDELYFCVTSGGAIKSGQIMRYLPARGAAPDHLELFLESSDPRTFNFGDNLAIAPNGHLVVCEDPYWGGERTYLPRMIDAAPCYLRGVTPGGAVYNVARLHGSSEFAGACFSPDGRTLFVNVMSPTKTLAIRARPGGGLAADGPWGRPLPGWRIYPAAVAVMPWVPEA